jgi:hypothetical protein
MSSLTAIENCLSMPQPTGAGRPAASCAWTRTACLSGRLSVSRGPSTLPYLLLLSLPRHTSSLSSSHALSSTLRRKTLSRLMEGPSLRLMDGPSLAGLPHLRGRPPVLRRRTPPSPRRTRMTPHVQTRCASHSSARTGRAGGAMHPCGNTACFGSPHSPFGAIWDRLLSLFASTPSRSRSLFRRAGTKRGIQTP